MARFLVVAAALAVATLSAPSAGRADQLPGGSFCFPGAFQACASVSVRSVSFVPGPTGGMIGSSYGQTVIVFRVVNLQGQSGVPTSGPFGILFLGLSHLTAVCPDWTGGGVAYCPAGYPIESKMTLGPGASVVSQGQVTCVGPSCTTHHWDVWGTGPGDLSLYSSYSDAHTVIGCDVPVGSLSDYSTCSGYVDIAAHMLGDWGVTDDSRLSVTGSLGNSSYSGPGPVVRFSCTVGEDCLTLTPEPVTLVLLGTGLFGMGAAQLRRRKKDPQIDA